MLVILSKLSKFFLKVCDLYKRYPQLQWNHKTFNLPFNDATICKLFGSTLFAYCQTGFLVVFLCQFLLADPAIDKKDGSKQSHVSLFLNVQSLAQRQHKSAKKRKIIWHALYISQNLKISKLIIKQHRSAGNHWMSNIKVCKFRVDHREISWSLHR